MTSGFETALTRRKFLARLLAGSGLNTAFASVALRRAIAMGLYRIPVGMYKSKGIVKVNGKPADKGFPIGPGDVVTTGANSMAIFIIGKDVYLVRENSHIELDAHSTETLQQDIVDILRIINGKMLSVFARGHKRIEMPTVIAGVRGSGAYVETQAQRTYFCLCYGSADIALRSDPTVRETIRTTHHESPFYIYAHRSNSLSEQAFVRAPVINHTDAELIMLEQLVLRKPPFYKTRHEGSGGY
jgi:hypothetical protein